MVTTVRNRVIPSYGRLPHFSGLTAVKRDLEQRSEVIVASSWDDGHEGSEEASARFFKEIVETAGKNPSRMPYDTLYAQVLNSSEVFGVGGMRWEGRPRIRPMAGETEDQCGVTLNGSGSAP